MTGGEIENEAGGRVRAVRRGLNWFGLAPSGANLGLFKVSFQYILAES